MTTLFTSYEVDNDKKFAKTIEDALSVVNDLSFEFGEITRDLFRSNKAVFGNSPGLYPDYFDSTTNTAGTATPYAASKFRKYGRVYPMLVASGKLMRSLTEPSAPNEDTVLNIGKKSLVVGTNVKNSKGVRYPLFHQSDKKPRTKMPLRKFLFIGPEARRYARSDQGRLERWTMIIEKSVERRLKRKLK